MVCCNTGGFIINYVYLSLLVRIWPKVKSDYYLLYSERVSLFQAYELKEHQYMEVFS